MTALFGSFLWHTLMVAEGSRERSIFFMNKTHSAQTKSRERLIKLCVTAVMAALFIVLESLSVRIGDLIKITFDGLPILITSFVLGPLYGTVAGTIGSFISQMMHFGFSATTVLWILPAAVRGLSSGLLFILFKRKLKILPLGTSIVVSSLLVSAFNTLTLYVDGNLYEYYNPVTFLPATGFRFVSGIITAILYTAIILPVMYGLKQGLPSVSAKES